MPNFKERTSNTQIFYTTEYSWFKLMDGNRFLNEKKIRKIINDVNNGLNFFKQSPIVVCEKNGRLEIIDGQHRFWSAKTLKLPIYYIITEPMSLSDIAKLNDCSERWRNHDYINLYVNAGNQDYILIKEFLEQTNIPLSTSLRMLKYGGMNNVRDLGIGRVFKTGGFKVLDYDGAMKIASYSKLFYRFTKHKSRPFLAALTTLADTGADLETIAENTRHGVEVQPFIYPAAYVKHLNSFLDK